MKKLLFVINVDWFFVSHRLPIALQAINQGYEVHLASHFTDRRQELESYGIVCHEIPFSRSGASISGEFGTLVGLRKLLVSIDPQVVHAVTVKPVLYVGVLLHSLKNKPLFIAAISGLGYVFAAKTARAKLTKFFVSIIYKISLSHHKKYVIFQNKSDQSVLSTIASLPENSQVLINGSGVDLSVYTSTDEPCQGEYIVTMASRLLREKGVYEFVEAAHIVKSLNREVKFQLVGSNDPENPNSVPQSQLDLWAEEGVIEVLGQRSDIPNIFKSSHVVTLPSFYGEGIPKVLIEAAACGRPIVTTDNPGCRDAVVAEKTGLIVPCRDADALAVAIYDLLEKTEKRVAMGKAARKFAIEQFDVKSVVDKHIKLYDSNLQG